MGGGMARVLRWRVALGALLALACTSRTGATGGAPSGGKMVEAGVTNIGKVVPGSVEGAKWVEELDPTPIVLWTGSAPAAVLTYTRHVERDDPTAWEELAVIPESLGGRRASGFPFQVRIRRVANERGVAEPETLEAGRILTADVDGDGTDELIVPRRHGAVEVLSLKGPLPRFAGPTAAHGVAGYAPLEAFVSRLPGREVVHLLLRRDVHGDATSPAELARIGAEDPFVVVRVDGAGARAVRVVGRGFAPSEILAVGAVNLPGSKEVDELLLLSRMDAGGELHLSRHRPDGALVEAPRKFYAPTGFRTDWRHQGWRFHFLAQSRTVLLAAVGYPRVYFLEPGKPFNWIRAVDVDAVTKPGEWVEHLGAVGADGAARAMLVAEGRVYSVDVDGRFFTPAGPSPKPAPWYVSRPPGPGFGRPIVVPSRDAADALLVLHARGRQTREPSHDEILAAAERHLLPQELARLRRRNEPTLEGNDPVRDRLIREERRSRKEEREVRSLEEWKALLPDSYAAYLQDQAAGLASNFKSSLTIPLRRPSHLTAENYRDPAGLGAWLAELDLPARVVFEVVERGAVVRALRAAAEDAGDATELTGLPPVQWRRDPAGDVIVAALAVPGPDGVPTPAFHRLRTAPEHR